VQRFLPSEFGMDGDRTGAVEPAKSMLAGKTAIRRAVEAAGVPYTYVVAGYFAGYTLPGIGQALSRAPPTDEAVVLGDGSVKAVFVEEGDIATYTVLAAADPRAENKTMYMKPPANTLSHNELLDPWERKAGRAFERVYVPEDAVLKQIQESPIPMSIVLAIAHAVYVRGGNDRLRDRPGVGGGRHRAVPGCQVHHRRRSTSTGSSEQVMHATNQPTGIHVSDMIHRDDGACVCTCVHFGFCLTLMACISYWMINKVYFIYQLCTLEGCISTEPAYV
jgi:hypothetical protein